jgi:hypothetical protein
MSPRAPHIDSKAVCFVLSLTCCLLSLSFLPHGVASLDVYVSCLNESLLSLASSSFSLVVHETSDELLVVVDVDSFSESLRVQSLRVVLRDCWLGDVDMTVVLCLPSLSSSSTGVVATSSPQFSTIEFAVENTTAASLQVVVMPAALNRTRIGNDLAAVLGGDRTFLLDVNTTALLLLEGGAQTTNHSDDDGWLRYPYQEEAKRIVSSLLSNGTLSANISDVMRVPVTITIGNGSVLGNHVAVIDRSDWWSTSMCDAHLLPNRSMTLLMVSNASLWDNSTAGGAVNSAMVGTDGHVTIGNISISTYLSGAMSVVVGAGATAVADGVSGASLVKRAIAPSCRPVQLWWNSLAQRDVVIGPLLVVVNGASQVGTSASLSPAFSDLAPLWRVGTAMSAGVVWRSFLSTCVALVNESGATSTNERCSLSHVEDVLVPAWLANDTFLADAWNKQLSAEGSAAGSAEALLNGAWSLASTRIFFSPRFTSGSATPAATMMSEGTTDNVAFILRPSVVVAANVSLVVAANSLVRLTTSNDSSTPLSSLMVVFLPPRLALHPNDTTNVTANLFLINTAVGVTVVVEGNSTLLLSTNPSNDTSVTRAALGIAMLASPLDTMFGLWAVGLVASISSNLTASMNASNATMRNSDTLVLVGASTVAVSLTNSKVEVLMRASTGSNLSSAAVASAVSIGLEMMVMTSRNNNSIPSSTWSVTNALTGSAGQSTFAQNRSTATRWSSTSWAALYSWADILHQAVMVQEASTLEVAIAGSIGTSHMVIQGAEFAADITTTSYAMSSTVLHVHDTCALRLLEQQGIAATNVTSFNRATWAAWNATEDSWDVCGGPWSAVMVTLDNSTTSASLDTSHAPAGVNGQEGNRTAPVVTHLVAALLTSVGGVGFRTADLAELLLTRRSDASSVGSPTVSIDVMGHSSMDATVTLSSFCSNSSGTHVVAVSGALGLVDRAAQGATVAVWPFLSTITVASSSLVRAEVNVGQGHDNCSIEWSGVVASIAHPYSESMTTILHPASTYATTTTVNATAAYFTAALNLSSGEAALGSSSSSIVAVGILCDGGTSCSVNLENTTVTTDVVVTQAVTSLSHHANIKLQNLPLLLLQPTSTLRIVAVAAASVLVHNSSTLRCECNTTGTTNTSSSSKCSNMWWLLPDVATFAHALNSSVDWNSSSIPPTKVMLSMANTTLIATTANFVVPHVTSARPVIVVVASGATASEERSYGTVTASWRVENCSASAVWSTVAPTLRPLPWLGGNESTVATTYPLRISVSVEMVRCSIVVSGVAGAAGGASALVAYHMERSANIFVSPEDNTTQLVQAVAVDGSLSVHVECSSITLGTSSSTASLFTTVALSAAVAAGYQYADAHDVRSTAAVLEPSNVTSSIMTSLTIAHSLVSIVSPDLNESASVSGILATAAPEVLHAVFTHVSSTASLVTFSTAAVVDQRLAVYASVVNVTYRLEAAAELEGRAWIQLHLFDNSSNITTYNASGSRTLHVSLDATHVNMVGLSANGSAAGGLPSALGIVFVTPSLADAEAVTTLLSTKGRWEARIPFSHSGTQVMLAPGSCVNTVGGTMNASTYRAASCSVSEVSLQVATAAVTSSSHSVEPYGNRSKITASVAVQGESVCETSSPSGIAATVCASPAVRAVASALTDPAASCAASTLLRMDPIHTLTPTRSQRSATASQSTLTRSVTSSATASSGSVTNTLAVVSRSSRTPSSSLSASRSASSMTSKASLSLSTSLGSLSARLVSRTSRTPSVSVNTSTLSWTPQRSRTVVSVTLSATLFRSKSTHTPSETAGSATPSNSKHVSKSTHTPSMSLGTLTPSTSNRVSKSTHTPTRSLSSANYSATPTLQLSSSKTPIRTPSVTMSAPSQSARLNVSATGVTPSLTPSKSRVESRTGTLTSSRTPQTSVTQASSESNTAAASLTKKSATVSASLPWTATVSRQTKTPIASASLRLTASKSPFATQTGRITATKDLIPTPTLTFPLPREGEGCSLPAFSVLPSQSIQDYDVRLGDVVVWMNLTSPFRWALHAPRYVVSGPLWTGSQPERSGWQHTVNLTCELYAGGKYAMRCSVPLTPAYKLLVEETVQFFVYPAAYDGDRCVAPREDPMLVGSLAITTELSPKIEVARAISTLIGVEGFLASWMGAQAMVYDGHLIAMVGQMSCGSNLDNFMTMRLMYLLAPMKDYGNFAVLYFNLALLGVFLVLHVAITFLIQRKKAITFNDAAEIAAFPGWSYCCAVALHSGICYGTMQIAFHSSDAEAVASAGGFAYIVTVFVVIFYVLRRFARVAFVEYGFIRVKPMTHRFFLPTGYWDPKQPRRMFGRMLVTVGAGRTMYVPYQMLLLTGFSVITCVRPRTVEGCRVLFLVLAAGIFLAATQVAWWRPHRVPFQNFTTTVTMTLLAIQCCLQGPSAADPTLNLDNTKAYMWIGQFVVIAVRGIFDTGLVLWENFMWGKDREPLFGVLDEDHFAGDDHSQAVDLYYGDLPPDMMQEDALRHNAAAQEMAMPKDKRRSLPPPPPPPGATAVVSLSSPYQRDRTYKDFAASESFTNRALHEDFGGDAIDEPRAPEVGGGRLIPQNSLGRWEGSVGSLSSDDML